MNYTIFVSMIMNYYRKLKTKKLMNYVGSEEGLVAIEYALIGSLIAVAIIVVVATLGNQIVGVFNDIVVALGGTEVAAPNTIP
jgi:pilus assembly protein Flp/PilA